MFVLRKKKVEDKCFLKRTLKTAPYSVPDFLPLHPSSSLPLAAQNLRGVSRPLQASTTRRWRTLPCTGCLGAPDGPPLPRGPAQPRPGSAFTSEAEQGSVLSSLMHDGWEDRAHTGQSRHYRYCLGTARNRSPSHPSLELALSSGQRGAVGQGGGV